MTYVKMPLPRSIMIVAGEPSGDRHAAKLVEAIRQSDPEAKWDFFGSAGPMMRGAGVDPIVVADELAIMGISEIGLALPMFLSAFRALRNAAVTRRPQVAILVDFPEFNLKLAKSLKKRGFTVVYYISPQMWAWRQYRIRTIRRYVDLLLTILPFEKEWYAKLGVDHVEFVGNPLASEVHPSMDRDKFCKKHSLNPDLPIIALLPGSRRKEIVRILPVLIEAAAEMISRGDGYQFVIPIAHERHLSDVSAAIDDAKLIGRILPDVIRVVTGETYDALNVADVAAVTSGTATLETGIIGTPMVIVYKTSKINFSLITPLISVEHFGLINLIAGERIAKELIQKDLTPSILSVELERLMDPDVNKEMRTKLRDIAAKLGPGGTSERAASAILRLIASQRSD